MPDIVLFSHMLVFRAKYIFMEEVIIMQLLGYKDKQVLVKVTQDINS